MKRMVPFLSGHATSSTSQGVKRRGKFASFTIKERQSLPIVNRYLIVFYVYAAFLDWKNGAE